LCAWLQILFFIDVKGISDWECVTTGVPEIRILVVVVDAEKEQLNATRSEN